MVGRRRLAYLALFLLATWTIATYYLAVVKTVGNGASPTATKQEIESRLRHVEESIADQIRANQELGRLIRSAAAAQAEGRPLPSVPALQAHIDAPIAVLVIACNRPKAIKTHLEALIRLRPSAETFPIIVSQDCGHAETKAAIEAFGDAVILISHPDTSDIVLPPKTKKFVGYYKLSRHYKWALNQTFFHLGYQTAIITEDDLEIGTDFFEYFAGTYPLLRVDSSLWCVSAWNDNGKASLIDQSAYERLRRSDFFPGLGWMLRKQVWEELEGSWPTAFWDDWMRQPQQRKGRACIRPEISRTAMSREGKVGVSRGLFFEKHLKHILLNQQAVKFTHLDLSYLLQDAYDKAFISEVYDAPSITQSELHAKKLGNGKPFPDAVRLTYDNKNTYKTTAKNFGLMDDFRAGVPRTAYRGVVEFVDKGTRVFLAPEPTWTGYDVTWT